MSTRGTKRWNRILTVALLGLVALVGADQYLGRNPPEPETRARRVPPRGALPIPNEAGTDSSATAGEAPEAPELPSAGPSGIM